MRKLPARRAMGVGPTTPDGRPSPETGAQHRPDDVGPGNSHSNSRLGREHRSDDVAVRSADPKRPPTVEPVAPDRYLVNLASA